MYEILGLYTIKLLGHGWIWHRGEKIDPDLVFGNGGNLFLIGFASSVFWMVAIPGVIILMDQLGWLR